MELIRIAYIGKDGEEHKGLTIKYSIGKQGIIKAVNEWLEKEL